MTVQKIPTGFRILIGVALFIGTFLIARPSAPFTSGQLEFWTWAADLFGEPDIEGFVGMSLWVICTTVTVIGYQVIVRTLNRRLQE